MDASRLEESVRVKVRIQSPSPSTGRREQNSLHFSKGETKSKVTKSTKFGGGRWQVRYLAFVLLARFPRSTIVTRSYSTRIRALRIPLQIPVVLRQADM
jgi:hypothetical protein